MAAEGVCSRYNQHQETVLHVLRECPFAITTWERLAYLSADRTNWETPLLPWITHHLKATSNSLLFGVACWSLWKARNEDIFTDIRITPESLAQRIRYWAESIEEALILDQSTHTSLPTKMMVDVSWPPPPPAWVALNSDGSVIPETRRAAAGGLLCDSDGRCLAAYSMNLGFCSITRAEMRAVVQGLHFAWEFGYRMDRVQLDSQVAIQLLMEEGERAHQHSSEVAQFRELLNRNWTVRVEHVYREGNRAADFLASLGHTLPIGVHSISNVDSRLSLHILYDLLGISQPRLIINTPSVPVISSKFDLAHKFRK
ncbi:unnamed protein product [Cuscuta europaea]|uniref:RNase H type-1 domain-containing protein n=1 Tax=Cuscuta europaea TaxID=41803 RepID=A0A9P0YKC7_CUSEU|nr:unnamed protein product [Cuscuta europaea]